MHQISLELNQRGQKKTVAPYYIFPYTSVLHSQVELLAEVRQFFKAQNVVTLAGMARMQGSTSLCGVI